MLIEKLRVIHDRSPRAAAVNMAFDEVLLERIAVPTLRLYCWQIPAVSFGYFIRHATVAGFAKGRELVRRMTGGGIVEHGSDLTYSLIFPAAHPLAASPPRESYRAIHSAIAEWMSRRSIEAHLAPPNAGTAEVCFEKAAEFDLLAGAQKVAGAAQRRTRAGLLHQGSIVFGDISDADRTDFPSAFSSKWNAESADPADLAAAAQLAANKYALTAWTTRV